MTTNKKTHNIEKVSKNSEESESEDESLWSHDSQELFSTDVVETESGNEMSGEILLSVLVEGVRKNVVALLDSETSQLPLNSKLADENATIKSQNTVRWETKAGKFSTKKKVLVKECQLLQFTAHRKFDGIFHLFTKQESDRYEAIIGRDLMRKLRIDLLYSIGTVKWGGVLKFPWSQWVISQEMEVG